jgi:hypothetical protein
MRTIFLFNSFFRPLISSTCCFSQPSLIHSDGCLRIVTFPYQFARDFTLDSEVSLGVDEIIGHVFPDGPTRGSLNQGKVSVIQIVLPNLVY